MWKNLLFVCATVWINLLIKLVYCLICCTNQSIDSTTLLFETVHGDLYMSQQIYFVNESMVLCQLLCEPINWLNYEWLSTTKSGLEIKYICFQNKQKISSDIPELHRDNDNVILGGQVLPVIDVQHAWPSHEGSPVDPDNHSLVGVGRVGPWGPHT